mgnify:CR=1 FL=1
MNQISAQIRRLSISTHLAKNDRRRFKYYYNNRFGYKRHFQFRGAYYLTEIDRNIPYKDKVTSNIQVGNQWRIRNKFPQVNFGLFRNKVEKNIFKKWRMP